MIVLCVVLLALARPGALCGRVAASPPGLVVDCVRRCGCPVAVCGAVAVCFDAIYIGMVSPAELFRRFVAYAV